MKWIHTGITFTILMMILLSSFIMSLFARRDQDAIHMQQVERWKNTNGQFEYTHGFIDFEERLLIEEIPNIKSTDRTTYFIGASNAKVSIMPWYDEDMHAGSIHVIGLSAATHTQQQQFIKYLIDEEGILKKSINTRFIIMLFYANAVDISKRKRHYFKKLFGRYPLLYSYTYEKGIQVNWSCNVERWIICEKIRQSHYLRRLLTRKFGISSKYNTINGRILPSKKHNIMRYKEYWTRYMGDHWEQEMDNEIIHLRDTINYLRNRGVQVTLVVSPLMSWQNDLPYHERYITKIQEICSASNTRLVSLKDLLPDEDFADSAHANYKGQQILHKALLDLLTSMSH